LKLSAIGYQTLELLQHPQQISSHDNTLNYHWNDILTERWVNSTMDLEQWFILNHHPRGAASGRPLTLQLTLDSDLIASQEDNNIRFVNRSDTTSITYNKLKVWDVTGRQLPARMQLDVRIQKLSLMIDDSSARYPLIIDPSFQQQAYVKATNSEVNDRFGRSVAIAGNTLVVGAPGEASNATGINGDQSDNSADNAGAAYIFTRTGSTWSQQAYLKASNTKGADAFGISVAIAGNTVVVGAFLEASNATGIDGDQSDSSAHGAGAAYVFARSDSTWSQQAYLKASNPEVNDRFGFSVSIADDTVVVGAFFEDSNAIGIDGNQSDNSANGAGAAYVFSRTGSTWSQQAYLKASNSEGTDRFGISVAIADDTMVVGASREASNATGVNGDQSDNSAEDAGAAYVFNLAPSITAECTLDADGNASADALTDGLLFIRYLFGIRGASLIDNSVANDCSHCSVAELEPILEQCGTTGTSDIDGNGQIDALTDGLLIIRYLFGIRGESLIEASVAADCSRCTVLEIETYLQGLRP
jgi:hypothetical protein